MDTIRNVLAIFGFLVGGVMVAGFVMGLRQSVAKQPLPPPIDEDVPPTLRLYDEDAA